MVKDLFNSISDDNLDDVNGGVTVLPGGKVAKFDCKDCVTPIKGDYQGCFFVLDYAFPNELGQIIYIGSGVSPQGKYLTAAFREDEIVKIGDVKGGI